MRTNTEIRFSSTPETNHFSLAKSFSNVRNVLHVVLLIVPVVLWLGWCLWCVVTFFAQSIQSGLNSLRK